MARMSRPLMLIWLLWMTVCASLASALDHLDERQSNNNGTSSSTFILETSGSNLTFAISADGSNGDIFFRFDAPSGNSWYGVGIGGGMKGALIFVMYQNSKGDGVTLSPRKGVGHTEPAWWSQVDCDVLSSSTANDTLSLTAHCQNVVALDITPKLDLTKTDQPFIYATGEPMEEISLKSNSPTASLKRHYWYGHFTMNMAQATASNGKTADVPPVQDTQTLNGAALNGQATIDHYFGSGAHAIIMCFAFVILFPAGVLLLRLLEKVKLHAGIQGIAMLFVIIGVGTGVNISSYYNKSRSISSGHQVVGLIVLCLVVIQFGLGLWHHLQFKKHKHPTMFGKIHLIAGPGIILLGISNGAAGFAFADVGTRRVVEYVIISVLILFGVAFLIFMKKRRVARNKKEAAARPAYGGNPHGYGQPAMPAPYGAPTQPYGAPPNHQYGGYYNQGRENSDVALERLDTRSTEQLPPYIRDDAQPPTYPRPMV